MSILGSPKDRQFIGLGYSFIDTHYFHSSLTYFGVYAVIRRYVWRKDDGHHGKHFRKGRLVSAATRKRLVERTGLCLRSIERALAALERNGWVKFIGSKGRRKILYLGDRVRDAAGKFTADGESYFADSMISAASVAEGKVRAGKTGIKVPVFLTRPGKDDSHPDTSVGSHPDTSVGSHPDTGVGMGCVGSPDGDSSSERISSLNREPLNTELLNRESSGNHSTSDGISQVLAGSDAPGSLREPVGALGSLRDPRAADEVRAGGEKQREGGAQGAKSSEATATGNGEARARRGPAPLTLAKEEIPDYMTGPLDEAPRRLGKGKKPKPAPEEESAPEDAPPKPAKDSSIVEKAAAGVVGAEFTTPPPAPKRPYAMREEAVLKAWAIYEGELGLQSPGTEPPQPTDATLGQTRTLLVRCGGTGELDVRLPKEKKGEVNRERYQRALDAALAKLTKIVRIAVWDWGAIQAIIRPRMTKGIPRPRIGDILFLLEDLTAFPDGVIGGSAYRTSDFAARYGRDGLAPADEGKTLSLREIGAKQDAEARTRGKGAMEKLLKDKADREAAARAQREAARARRERRAQ